MDSNGVDYVKDMEKYENDINVDSTSGYLQEPYSMLATAI